MKIVLTLTFVIAVIVSAVVGCLVVLEILTFDEGKDYIIKALSVIIILGVSSAAVALVTGNKNTPGE